MAWNRKRDGLSACILMNVYWTTVEVPGIGSRERILHDFECVNSSGYVPDTSECKGLLKDIQDVMLGKMIPKFEIVPNSHF